MSKFTKKGWTVYIICLLILTSAFLFFYPSILEKQDIVGFGLIIFTVIGILTGTTIGAILASSRLPKPIIIGIATGVIITAMSIIINAGVPKLYAGSVMETSAYMFYYMYFLVLYSIVFCLTYLIKHAKA
ncbi:MAG: hypothetical protein COV55_04230 [Candidatus Komeilibacteria bacterium CG11_big_fil_rev_8_21_14_0_20_36_20]|uniref:Uncharacterized protein n=1 Tax=Candidatus Komeilibacteria bacterium CG11_big_fil_rev_8_21_14_0_20_36_20 TaxID=1974477 RepID=A0A2H0NBN2_9BACT|nr:MAG: hypothetical protein COV55_04230 [Candidatus Komeilibacteria bacterium CG11_big_fil_rev_8_21_14_0_20_36_20]PIR81451.1 MAG: hypothetical protein COU21_03460 [Candidatus Komeilibacteria bacterium CG10_big_fil_rev_8_21_14_0_10_36_65]PJC55652.1 MAG: hypothetical protein CO027_00815 [Candidatus Komeilibacteria bacterium CG_4_9_14_0_2_um_filter_36_13]